MVDIPFGVWGLIVFFYFLVCVLKSLYCSLRRHHSVMPVKMAVVNKPQIINAGEDGEKKEPFYTVGGNVNWCSHYEEK